MSDQLDEYIKRQQAELDRIDDAIATRQKQLQSMDKALESEFKDRSGDLSELVLISQKIVDEHIKRLDCVFLQLKEITNKVVLEMRITNSALSKECDRTVDTMTAATDYVSAVRDFANKIETIKAMVAVYHELDRSGDLDRVQRFFDAIRPVSKGS